MIHSNSMKTLLLMSGFAISVFAFAAGESRPKIMLTGYWPPTNEMVRPFSQNLKQNPDGWKGENFENSGFDIVSYFPEFANGELGTGQGDFEVDFNATKASFNSIVPKVKPIALLSFGLGDGPWEIETNAKDYWHHRRMLHSTLQTASIAAAVNATGALKAWVDTQGDAGDFLCGFLFRTGAEYRQAHSALTDASQMRFQGFIHVGEGFTAEQYKIALNATLEAVVSNLKSTKSKPVRKKFFRIFRRKR